MATPLLERLTERSLQLATLVYYPTVFFLDWLLLRPSMRSLRAEQVPGPLRTSALLLLAFFLLLLLVFPPWLWGRHRKPLYGGMISLTTFLLSYLVLANVMQLTRGEDLLFYPGLMTRTGVSLVVLILAWTGIMLGVARTSLEFRLRSERMQVMRQNRTKAVG